MQPSNTGPSWKYIPFSISSCLYKNKKMSHPITFCLRQECFLFLVSPEYRIDIPKHTFHKFLISYKVGWRLEMFVLQPLRIKSLLPPEEGPVPLCLLRHGALNYCRGPRLQRLSHGPSKSIFQASASWDLFCQSSPSHYFTTMRLSSQVRVKPHFPKCRVLFIH